MSHLNSNVKGSIPVGAEPAPGVPAFSFIVPGAPGDVLTVDPSTPTGWKTAPAGSGAVDPRDIMRFSMMHNVGVTGGG